MSNTSTLPKEIPKLKDFSKFTDQLAKTLIDEIISSGKVKVNIDSFLKKNTGIPMNANEILVAMLDYLHDVNLKDRFQKLSDLSEKEGLDTMAWQDANSDIESIPESNTLSSPKVSSTLSPKSKAIVKDKAYIAYIMSLGYKMEDILK